MNAPARIHTVDGSVCLAEQGFIVRNDTIWCLGVKYDFTRRSADPVLTTKMWSIPADSIAGVEYVKPGGKGVRDVGNLLWGATLGFYTAAAAAVVAVAIFGSCPTFYTLDREGRPVLEAEGFSYSIGRYFETGDLDRLHVPTPPDGRLRLDIRNEALETHYINQVGLRYLDHPPGTEAYPGAEPGSVFVLKPHPLVSAMSMNGQNILGAILRRDTMSYESDDETTSNLLHQAKRDYIECELDNPAGSPVMTIALRGRNTLENTVLLYDVMMRNQGPLVMDWMKKVNENPVYAYRLYRWYRNHSGIEVLVERDGEFESAGRIPDTGPIAWKETAVQIPVDATKKTVRVRFAFLPESWAIDWIASDDQGRDAESLVGVSASSAAGNTGDESGSILGQLREDDDEYLVNYPGTLINLTFDVPQQQSENRTYFLWSKGYYVEWVRGEWMKARDDIIVFDISNPKKISKDLAEVWLQKRDAIKQQFYAQKIPLAR